MSDVVATSLKEVRFEMGNSVLCGLSTSNNIKKSKEIVLCLHGWLDNAASFISVIEHLENQTIVAIDLPGHGKSSHKSADAHYHFIDWVYDILSLIEFNQWESIHLVGHSMGGMISSAFTAAFPEKVKSLTLIDSFGVIYGKENESTNQLRKGMLNRYKINHQPIKIHKKLTLDKATKARVLVSDLQYEHAQAIVARNLEAFDDGFYWRSDKRLKTISPYRLTKKQAEQMVSDISVPTQVIYGSKGMDFVRESIDHFSPMIKNATFKEVDGGHHVHMEKPQVIAILIQEIISKSNVQK